MALRRDAGLVPPTTRCALSLSWVTLTFFLDISNISSQNLSHYDIESRIASTGQLRFIEVKGRIEDATTVTVTKNEIITALNKPEDFILALVQVPKSEEFTEGDVWRVRASQGTYKVHKND